MKKHSSDHNFFNGLKMLDNFAQSEGMSIKDEMVVPKFIQRLLEAIQKQRENPIRVHGFRAESMFAHIAAALGRSKIITEEDSGSFFSYEEEIRRPDFRLVTIDGNQLLVEVKNFRQKKPFEPLVVKSAYLLTLKKYADTFNIPLKIAIFWSRWEFWTLVDIVHYINDELDVVIRMQEAMKISEMNLLGDLMVGTVPPLSLRIYTDTKRPRSVNKAGEVRFTIGKVALYAGGQEIIDEFEQRLVWFFMLHGKWKKLDEYAKVRYGLLEYMDLTVSPEEYDKERGFAMLGFLSELITSNYKFLTSQDGEVLQLSPSLQPDQLCVLIPHDYKGKTLKLWRFHVQPNHDDLKKRRR